MKILINVLVFSVRRFFAEKRLLWAASLTYTTVFSLIPLLSVLFFVFNIFGSLAEIKTMVQPYIYKTLAPWAQEKVISILNELVNNIDFSTIGFFSMSLLIISIFLLIFEIEYALNEIWLIKVKLSVLSRAAIYWLFLTIGPILVALALFIFFTLQAYIPPSFIEAYVNSHGVALLSYALILTAFTVIYFLMPGAPVHISSAALGGFIAASLWKLSALAFNIYASRFFFYYPKIFGSLAAIPLFLLWIFLCWVLFLFGAEIVYLHQNRSFYATSHESPPIQGLLQVYYLLMTYLFIVREYYLSASPVTLKHAALSLRIPYHIIRELTDGLQKCCILKRAAGKDSFVPAQPFPGLTLASLLDAVKRTAYGSAEVQPAERNNLHRAVMAIIESPSDDRAVKTVRDLLPLLTAAG